LPLPRGNRRILWDYINPYFSMPLLMADGGYAFEKVNGSYDATTTGINTDGAIAGATMLLSLITDQFLPPDMNYQIMDDAMNGGRVAMVINGPWAWANLAVSGVDFGVAPIPSVGGHASPTFVTVHALVINSASANRELAKDFIETALTSDAALAIWNTSDALGALADTSAAAAQPDPNIAAMLAIAATGVPLPNNPEMGAFWQIMRDALTEITTMTASPTDALNAAAERMTATSIVADSG
jgi:maltose/maltodextrin transport system substrate-binding protein